MRGSGTLTVKVVNVVQVVNVLGREGLIKLACRSLAHSLDHSLPASITAVQRTREGNYDIHR
jgi:hypothetical protein